MGNPFLLEENPFQEGQNPFLQEGASPSPKTKKVPEIKEEGGILPSFLNFDTPEAKEKREQLFKADPEKFLRMWQRADKEAARRGVSDIGEGFKQLALEAYDNIANLGVLSIDIENQSSSAEEYTQRIEQERGRYEETYGLFPGTKLNRFIGANAPYAVLPVKLPVGLFARTGAGSALGGAMMGSQFVPEDGSRTINTAIGAGVGGAIPVVNVVLPKLLSWSKNLLVDPFTKNGIYEDVAKFLQREIPENRGAIEQAIKTSIAKGENKTVAQIIAETTKGSSNDFGGLLVRLEKDLSRGSDSLKSLYALQKKEHQLAIDKIAGTEDELVQAISMRSQRSELNYQTSYALSIKADPELSKIANNKWFQVAANDAADLAQAKGIDAKKNLTEFLHYTKEGLDKQLNATDAAGKTALGREELRTVQKIKTNLVSWLGGKNPLYEKARAQHQLDSVPINRMEVGHELKKSYLSALGRETPAMFVKSLRDIQKTVKKATGFGKIKKAEDILTKQQVQDLNKIASDLTTKAQQETMASKSASVMKNLKGLVSISLPHILSRPIVITNHALKAFNHDRTPRYKELLADLIQNPEKFLKAYSLPEKNQTARMAIDIIERLEIIAAANTAPE